MKGAAWAVVALAVTVASLQAGVIGDATFFAGLDPTVIPFEYYADGTPVDLEEGEWTTLYYDEYIGSGVWFAYEPYGPGYYVDIMYVNDQGEGFDAAQAIGGSPEIGIPGGEDMVFDMVFEVPVHSAGFWLINNDTAETIPSLTAKDAGGNVIESVTFEGDLIDGTIEDPNGGSQYGFIGIWADQEIKRLTIVKEWSLIDNLTFSAETPEPASLALLSAGALAVLRRRRRH